MALRPFDALTAAPSSAEGRQAPGHSARSRGVAILAVLASGWVTLVLLAPWLPVPLAGIVYLLGGRICHQIAVRSFWLGGAQLPVCARCLGTYAGAGVALAYASAAGRSGSRGANLTGSRHTHVLLGALALNGLTVAVEWSDLWRVLNPMRAVAGAALGIAVAYAIRQALPATTPATNTKRAPIQ